MSNLVSLSWILFVALLVFQSSNVAAYNVVSYGARGDGKTDSTSAFLQTWAAACRSVNPAAVSIPRGTFLVRHMAFIGPCRNRIHFQIIGTLVAPTNYNAIGSTEFWIKFHRVNRLTITGGAIDARGSKLWSCKSTRSGCPTGVRSLAFQSCSNVIVSGLKMYNSQGFHMSINQSNKMKIEKMLIRAPTRSQNTDGIHVELSRDITISRSIIKTGDDCISLGPGSMNMLIEHIGCGPGHGISVGSLAGSSIELGVQNVTVKNSVFTKTRNGVRIKSWARPSTGYARNLMFRNLVMRNVGNPIIIDQKYCPFNFCPSHQDSGIKVSQITFKSIRGTSSTQRAITLVCSPSNPCNGIKLQDIRLTHVNHHIKPTQSYCEHVGGSVSGTVFPRSCL